MSKKKRLKKIPKIEIAFGWRENVFVIDSDGRKIDHPEFYTRQLDCLAYLNQKVARRLRWKCEDCKAINVKYKTVKRKKRCMSCGSENIHKYSSKNREKAKYTLSKFHEHIANKRSYFLWHVARMYAENYAKVIVQKWPLKKEIEYAVDNKTARRLCDGAYGKFIQHLKHKCNELGTEFIERKDLSWQKEIERLTEQANLETLARLLRQAKKTLKCQNPARLAYLKTDLKRVETLRL